MHFIAALLLNKTFGRKLSDIEFLAIKEFGSKLVENESGRATTGDLGTLTASGSHDMYLASAKVSVSGTAGEAAEQCVVELKVNGVVKETFRFKRQYAASGGADTTSMDSQDYEFKNIGQKVTTTQIIKLEVISVTSCNIEGYVQCFEELTGVSPAV